MGNRKAKILSSYEGRITRLLLVDNIGTNGELNPNDVEAIIERQRIILEALTPGCDPELFYEILVQLNSIVTKANGDPNQDPHNQCKRLESALHNYKDKLEQAIRKRIRFTIPNLEFEEIIKEIDLILKQTTQSHLELKGNLVNDLFTFIQDPIIAMRHESGFPIILEPFYCWIASGQTSCNAAKVPGEEFLLSKYIPEILTTQTNIVCRSTIYYFQGGNVIAGDNFVVVGSDLIKKNLIEYKARLGEKPLRRLRKSLAATLGVNSVVCPMVPKDLEDGTMLPCQPTELFHLDLFLTLAGKAKNHKTIAFVGQIYEEVSPGEWVISTTNDNAVKYLDDFADWLKKFRSPSIGFEVKRLPLPRRRDDEGSFLYYSYNNCLVEVDGDLRRVFLPAFAKGITATQDDHTFKLVDDLVYELWHKAGFEIRILVGLRERAPQGAGLNCLTKVLERSKS